MIDFKIFNCLKLIIISYLFYIYLSSAIRKHFVSAIPIVRYILATQLQNYYNLMIYQKIFAKISIKNSTFAEN